MQADAGRSISTVGAPDGTDDLGAGTSVIGRLPDNVDILRPSVMEAVGCLLPFANMTWSTWASSFYVLCALNTRGSRH